MTNQVANINLNTQFSPLLSDSEAQIITAFTHPRLALYFKGELKIEELKMSLIDIISKAAFNCGQSMNKEDLKANYQVLLNNLKQDYKYLTIKEIEIAFEKGSKGVYGEFFGLNQKTFYKWIDAYIHDEARRKASEKQLKYLEELTDKTKRLSEEVIAHKNKQAAVRFFKSYNSNDALVGTSGECAKMLMSNLFEKLKHHFMHDDERIRTFVLSKLKREIELDKKDPFKRKKAQQLEAEINKDMDNCMAFKNEHRYECVKIFFSYLKEKGLELDGYL